MTASLLSRALASPGSRRGGKRFLATVKNEASRVSSSTLHSRYRSRKRWVQAGGRDVEGSLRLLPEGAPLIISLIAAMAENRVIGRNNKMPWDLPSDRRRFHAVTRGHPIILGRKTFESIGRPLSHRTNIVLTRNRNYRAAGAVIVHDLQSAFDVCAGADEVFVCGGEEVFREMMPLADRIYLTIIHEDFVGDAVFPEVPAYFREVYRKEIADSIPYALVRYERSGKRAGAPGP